MALPTEKEIEALYDKYEMYDNIKKHSKQVARIAVFVTKQLISQGVSLPLEEIEKGALLHDIAKTICLKNNLGEHNALGAQIMFDEGFPELAPYVFLHTSNIISEKNGIEKWFAQPLQYKIVILGDAHVKNFTIVSLDERFQYLHERYPHLVHTFGATKEAITEFKNRLEKKYNLDLDFCKMNKTKNE